MKTRHSTISGNRICGFCRPICALAIEKDESRFGNQWNEKLTTKRGGWLYLVSYDTNAETDADGYYLLDELEQGDYVASCVAYGYQIPETVSFSLGEQEFTEVDFELVPLAAI